MRRHAPRSPLVLPNNKPLCNNETPISLVYGFEEIMPKNLMILTIGCEKYSSEVNNLNKRYIKRKVKKCSQPTTCALQFNTKVLPRKFSPNQSTPRWSLVRFVNDHSALKKILKKMHTNKKYRMRDLEESLEQQEY